MWIYICVPHYFQYFKLADTEPEYWNVPYLLICIFFCLLQRILEMEAHAILHEHISMGGVGFSLNKTMHKRRNVVGQKPIINILGQCRENAMMCATITQNGVLYHHCTLGPYNSAHMLTFLEAINNKLIPNQNLDTEQCRFVVIWDNVSFYRAVLSQNWFAINPQFTVVYLIPMSTFSKSY